ncbi:MAG: PLL family lectin [Deltaproteobacteria bacterium]
MAELGQGKARLSLTSEEQLPALPCQAFNSCCFKLNNVCQQCCVGGVTIASNPAVASWGPGNLDVAVVGSDKNLYYLQETSGSWGNWTNAGSLNGQGVTGDPALTAYIWQTPYGRFDFAVQDGTTEGLDHYWYDFKCNCSGWEAVTGVPQIVPSPSIAIWDPGNFSVLFAEPGSGSLFEIHERSAYGWSGVSQAPATPGPIAGSPAAASTQNVTACNGADLCGDIFGGYRDQDGVLHVIQMAVDQNSGTTTFDTPVNFQESVVDRPALTSRARGQLDLYAQDATTMSLQHRTFASSLQSSGVGAFTAEWLAPELQELSVPPASVPGIASPGPGRVDLVYLGTDGNLYHAVQAASAMPTHHGDPQRTGAKLDEVDLNAGNVSQNAGLGNETFGHLWDWTVDGDVHAEPLYAPQVPMVDGFRHNAVFVATANNSVYAFDADSSSSTPIWKTDQTKLGHPVPWQNGDFTFTEHLTGCFSDSDLGAAPFQGIMSTPVIDANAGLMYVVAFTGTTSTGAALNSCTGLANACAGATCTVSTGFTPTDIYNYDLYALSLYDGSIQQGPVAIEGSVAGNGDAPFAGNGYLDTYAPGTSYNASSVTFSPTHQMQRPALLLSNGLLYVGFGSFGDNDPYHGWLFAYQASNLSQVGVFLTTPSNLSSNPYDRGAIWQSGGGPAADEAGNVYVEVGNGSFQSGTNYGDSLVRLSYDPMVRPALSVSDYFTPYNQQFLFDTDSDLGSAGPMVWEAADPHLVIAAGKQGEIYAMQSDKLTTDGRHYNTSGGYDNVLQEFFDAPAVPSSNNCGCMSGNGFDYSWPVAWTSQQGSFLYLWPAAGPLYGYQAYSYACRSGGWPFCTQTSTNYLCVEGSLSESEDPNGSCASPAFGSQATQSGCSQGGWLSLSANEGMPGSGIVWAVLPPDNVATKAELHAFNALNLAGGELWNSEMNSSADSLVGASGYKVWHFTTPMVANGKVFVPTGFGSSGQSPVVHVYGILVR